jgi:hypothetical protein
VSSTSESYFRSIKWDDGGLIVVTTSYSEEKSASAHLLRISASGELIWRRTFDTDNFDAPTALHRNSDKSISFIVHEHDANNSREYGNRIRKITLNESGAVLDESAISLPTVITTSTTSALFEDSYIWITQGGAATTGKPTFQMEALTGYTVMCGSLTNITNIYKLDARTLKVVSSITLPGFHGRKLVRLDSGTLLVGGGLERPCRFDFVPSMLQLTDDLNRQSTQIALVYGAGLKGWIADFQVKSDGTVIMAGALETEFDIEPYEKKDPNIPYKVKPHGDLVRESYHTFSAFLVSLQIGKSIADRVYSDLRGRIFSVLYLDGDDALLGGLAGGATGWIVRTHVSAPN